MSVPHGSLKILTLPFGKLTIGDSWGRPQLQADCTKIQGPTTRPRVGPRSAVDGKEFENGPREFETWQGLCPISSTETSSPIPLLHRWLPDRFCLNNHPAIYTSCPSKQCLSDWAKSLLLLDGLEDSGFMSQAFGQTCSGQEIRLETYYAVCPDSD